MCNSMERSKTLLMLSLLRFGALVKLWLPMSYQQVCHKMCWGHDCTVGYSVVLLCVCVFFGHKLRKAIVLCHEGSKFNLTSQ